MSADPQRDLRREFVAAIKQWRVAQAAFLRHGGEAFDLAQVPLNLSNFADLRCGARTRAGSPCKQRALYDCGRCRLHGGLSTGPRTPAGKAKSKLNSLKAKRTP